MEKPIQFGSDSEREKSPVTEEPVETFNVAQKGFDSAAGDGMGVGAAAVTHTTT